MKSKIVLGISPLVFFFALATARAETFEERVNAQHPNTHPYFSQPTYRGHRLIAIFPEERTFTPGHYRWNRTIENTDFDRVIRQRAEQLCSFLGHGPLLAYEIQWAVVPEIVSFLSNGVVQSEPVAMKNGLISWAVYTSLQCSLSAVQENPPQ